MRENKQDINVCPFCGKSWLKPKKPIGHHYVKLAAEAGITTGVAALTVLLLKLFGL